MPLYEYQCQNCKNTFETFFSLKKFDVTPCCPDCGGDGDKKFTAQIQRDEPIWLDDSVRDALQDRESDHQHIGTRTEYNRYLKENGIVERC